MNMIQTYKHWRLERDTDGILWIYFDKQHASVNTIDPSVMEEFARIAQEVAADKTCKAAIIASGKKNGFIAGADIAQFTKFKDASEAIEVLKLGQGILNKWEALRIPTIAIIDGFCLGGGLELALACRYRIAADGEKTRLGLPEVKLGIHPGWGGTVRLPRIMGQAHILGFLQSLELILTGRTVSAKAAEKLGFVDAAVPKRQLIHAAKYYALQQPQQKRPFAAASALFTNKIVRQLTSYYLRKKLRQKINPLHYPAPFQVLDNWEYIPVTAPEAYEREAASCGKLFLSETCQNLVRVFFLQERLKGLDKGTDFHPQHIHVIGAGAMGGDIAAWCALSGLTVTLQDLQPQFIAPALQRAYLLFKEKLKQPHLIQQAMDRLNPDLHGLGVAKADVIIEAVKEDLAIKQAVFKEIEKKAKRDAILATNTSSIPLDEINIALTAPERLVGIHFFNPVAKMLLVEIVQGSRTSAAIVNKATSFVRQIDRLPLPVKSSPGFLVNRILMPYLLESVELLNEGVPMTIIDKAMLDFGMPMGPITLADTVGLDICLSVAQYLSPYFKIPVPQQLIKLVEEKKLGKKTKQGFYKYDKQGKKITPEQKPYSGSSKEIADRLVARMINESFACLREGVVADGDLLDAGMIFGTGFAPFRGGPVHYAQSLEKEHAHSIPMTATEKSEKSEQVS